MIFRIPKQLVFPEPKLAEPDGLLGVGGDLNPHRVLLAYENGIFPWFSEGQPILWWSPDPRAVLNLSDFRVQRSLRKRVKQRPYRITMDTDFEGVIEGCSAVHRPGQGGTWITKEMKEAYISLHEMGFAHSVEAWNDADELVGGLYGVAVGATFCGESMFARASDASKIAFVHFVRQVQKWGVRCVDCQMTTDHLARFGASLITREEFLSNLAGGKELALPATPWHFDPEFTAL